MSGDDHIGPPPEDDDGSGSADPDPADELDEDLLTPAQRADNGDDAGTADDADVPADNDETGEDEAAGSADADRKPLGKKVQDRLPDEPYPSLTDPDALLPRAAEEVSSATAGLAASTAIALSKVVPGSQRFWRGLMSAGYRGMYATTDSDVIGHILVGGEVKAVPLEYDYEKGRYENPYGDYWSSPSGADNEYRIAGRVPTVWASAASNELGSHVQAEVAEVLDMGENRPLVNGDIDVVLDASQADMQGQAGQGQAMADGGVGYSLDVDIGQHLDEIVDLGHDDKARVVSMEKYYETFPSRVAPEEMKRQEERGRRAEQTRDYGRFVVKIMLIALGMILAAVVGPDAVNYFLGGSGGGGGSILPALLPLLGLRRE